MEAVGTTRAITNAGSADRSSLQDTYLSYLDVIATENMNEPVDLVPETLANRSPLRWLHPILTREISVALHNLNKDKPDSLHTWPLNSSEQVDELLSGAYDRRKQVSLAHGTSAAHFRRAILTRSMMVSQIRSECESSLAARRWSKLLAAPMEDNKHWISR